MLAVVGLLALMVIVTCQDRAHASPATGPILTRAGEHLRQDPIWIDPEADASAKLSDEQVSQLRDVMKREAATARQGAPAQLYVAILPLSVKNEVENEDLLVSMVATATGRDGIYAVVVGPAKEGGVLLRAGAYPEKLLPQAASLADEAYSKSEGKQAFSMLLDYADKVRVAKPAQEDGFNWELAIWIGVAVLGVIVIIAIIVALARRLGRGSGSGGYYGGSGSSYYGVYGGSGGVDHSVGGGGHYGGDGGGGSW